MDIIHLILYYVYQFYQYLTALVFAPHPPEPQQGHVDGPRIAIIGAGITGVSSAAHCIGHGFNVTIFEAGSRNNLGGIWSRVNETSSLQVHSIMYRFHPTVRFRKKYPNRQRILEEVTALWERYCLQDRTIFDHRVEKVRKDEGSGKWIVDDEAFGHFDGVIAAVGTCGEPKMPHIPGQEDFKGPIYHSSQLDGKDVEDKDVLVIGGGASAVEAVEFTVHHQARKSYILSRSDKWIIPRNPFVDAALAMNVFGEEKAFRGVPEVLLRRFFYRDLKELAPPKNDLFTETPMVNDAILDQIRAGKVSWLRGDIRHFVRDGIVFNHRDQGVPTGGPGKEMLIKGDFCVMATGFQRPSLAFFPPECFNHPYAPPNWYLQTFPVGYPDLLANNCTYINAIGTVGNLHIGIYTRFLLMFIADPRTRPSTEWMRMWVDSTRWMKSGALGGALEFFSWSELMAWFVFSVVVNPRRWRWALFVLCGIGTPLPKRSPSGTEDGAVPYSK